MTLKHIIYASLLFLGLTVSAQAQRQGTEADCGFFTLTIPEGWELTDEITRPGNDVCRVTVGREDRSVIVTSTVGPAGGRDARTAAQQLADRMSVQTPLSERQGQYGFDIDVNGQKSTCVVAVEKDVLGFTCIVGGKHADAAPLLQGFKSTEYPGIIPAFD